MIENGNFQSIFGLNADEFFNSFNKGGSESISTLTQFCGKFKEMDDTMRSYLTDCMQKQVPASFGGYNKYVQSAINSNKQLTASAKAAKIGMQALATVGNMIAYALIAKGIQLAADAIDHYVNRAKYAAEAMEEAQQAIDDAQSSLKNVFTTLSENKDRFLELSQGVDKFSKNLSLSEEDYAEYLSISNQLAELSPSLVSGYDEQGNALLAIGKNADETNEKLQSVLENQQAIAQQTLIDNMDDVATGIYYEVEDAKSSIESMETELASLQDQFKEVNVDIASSNGLISFSDDDYSKYGKAMENALTSAGIEFEKNASAGLYTTAIQLVSASPQQLEQAQKFYDAWLNSENEYYHASENGLKQDIEEKEKSIETSYAKMTANLQAWVKDNYNYQYLSDDASAMVDALIPEIKWDELEEAPITASDYQNYVEENIIKPLMEVPQEHKQEIDNMLQQLLSFEDGDLDVLEFAEQLQARLKELGITIDITPIIADEQEAKDKLQNSIEAIAEGGSSDFTTSSGVKVDADDYKTLQEYTKDFTSDQIELWNKSTLGAENATDAINKYEEALKSASNPDEITVSTISSSIQQIATQLEPQFAKLGEAYQNIFTADGFTLDNVDNSMLEELRQSFAEIEEEVGVAFDATQLNDFFDVLTSGNSTAEQVQQSFNDLATAYFYSTDTLEQLNETTADSIAKQLEELGVINAKEVVYDTLTTKTEALALQEQLVAAQAEATARGAYFNVDAFLNQAGATETARMYLFQLVSAEQIFNNQDLNTAEKIAELKELATAYGQTAIAARIANLEKASADGHIPIDYDKELNALQADINNAVNNVKVDFTPITKASGKAGKDSADAYVESYEKELKKLQALRDQGEIDESEFLSRMKALYERYFSGISKYQDKYFEEQHKYLEGMKSLHDSALSGITKLIGKKIDGYQDAKDTAIESLEAEKEAAEEAYQAQIDAIDEQIEAKQKIIDGINDEIDAMQEANDERKRQLDLQQLIAKQRQLENQRTELIFKSGENGGQLVYRHDSDELRKVKQEIDDKKFENEIAQKEKRIDLIEDEIDLLEEQKNALEEMKDASNEYYDKLIKQQEKYYDSLIKNAESQKSKWEELAEIQEVAEAYSAIEQVFGDLGYSVEDVLNGSAGAFEDFKAKYISIISDLNSNSSFTEGLSYATGVAKEDLGSFIDKTKEAGDAVGELGNKGSELDAIANSMDNTASSAETLNTNTEGVDENLSGISDSLNTMPESTKVSNLATAFGELATEIQNVADALGIGADESVSGLVQALTEISNLSLGDADKELGIIAQFGNLKAKVDEVTNAISGGSSSSAPSKGTNNVASGIAQAGLNANAESGSANSLTGAIKEMARKAEESLGNGGDDSEEGTIGRFNALKTAVQNVVDLIGTEASAPGSAEGAENLISAIQLQYDRATKILPLEKLLFVELLTTIDKCVVSLNKMVSAFNTIAELGGMPTLPNGGGGGSHSSNSGSSHGGGGHSRGYAEGTVGKAFANGTGGYNGLPHDEKNALRSEYGQPELTVYPDGTTELTTEPTMSDLPKDTVIFNEEQTKRIMNNKGTVLGNAYADGTDNLPIIQKVEIPSYLRPLQEGDKGYELTQKFLAHQDKLINQIIPPVTAIERNMELMTKNINNVNTNNVNKPSLTINGGINVTCPGVTSKEVAMQVSNELEKAVFGMSNYAYQKSSITR